MSDQIREKFEAWAKEHVKQNPEDWMLTNGYENEEHWALIAWQSCAESMKAERDERDAKRLDWIGDRLFGHNWNGVVDSGSRTHWSIWSGYRHITQTMQGVTFREAIDAAMLAAAPKEQS